MRGLVISVSTLLFGTFVFLVGNGLLGTLLSVRIELEHLGADIAGYVSSAYFVGFMAASLFAQRLVRTAGHIRAFAAFAGISAAVAILAGLYFHPIALMILRGVGGFAIAGLFMVIESWLNATAESRWRGRLLSIYMITVYSALSAGQLLLDAFDPMDVHLFALVGALFALSLVPVSLSQITAPPLPAPSFMTFAQLYRISPMGIAGSFSSGLILGAFYGLFPIVAKRFGGLEVSQIATLMSVLIFFGLMIQWPVGWASDRTDRRYVIIVALFSVMASCVGILWLQAADAYPGLWLVAGLGFALAFAIYPLSVAHANDLIKADDLVAASGGLLLAYSGGAAIGPIVAGQIVERLPAGGLLYYMVAVAAATGLFAFWRTRRRPASVMPARDPFVVMPRTTQVAAELDPRTGTEPELFGNSSTELKPGASPPVDNG